VQLSHRQSLGLTLGRAQGGLDLLQFGVQPFALGMPPDQAPALPGPPEDVGEAQEGEGFRLALAPGPAVLIREPSELEREPDLVQAQCAGQRRRFEHEHGLAGLVRRHRPLGAAPAAQQLGEPPRRRSQLLGIRELEDLLADQQ
jgi:hypothetical protein